MAESLFNVRGYRLPLYRRQMTWTTTLRSPIHRTWQVKATIASLAGLFLLFVTRPESTPLFRQVGGIAGAHALASYAPAPSYPQASIDRGVEGLAVAEVEVDARGHLTRLDVLDAPDVAITHAVESSVRTWKFKTAAQLGLAEFANRDLHSVGRLFFYFRLNHGKGIVSVPGDPRPRP
jgi:Gram-negative bacterial TonB protein C-terminal